ncbi:MAG: hypothetical protein KKH94_09110 [Candidatus Omnitrophica bacterium]|nr:hypothetical protein [Candidatus Omnitrophota bacterium]
MFIIAVDTCAYTTAFSVFDAEARQVMYSKVLAHSVPFENYEADLILPWLHRRTLSRFTREYNWKSLVPHANRPVYCAVSSPSGLQRSVRCGEKYCNTVLQKFIPVDSVLPIDHALGHVVSAFIEQEAAVTFPLLVFSASAAHTSVIYFRTIDDNAVLFEGVPYCMVQGSSVPCGLGKIYYLVIKRLLHKYAGEAGKNDFTHFDVLVSHGMPKHKNELLGKITSRMRFDCCSFLLLIEELLHRDSVVKKEDVACSFYEAFGDLCIKHLEGFFTLYDVAQIHLCGGIANNRYIVKELEERFNKKVLIPKQQYRHDNAAMIAYAGYLTMKRGLRLHMKEDVTYEPAFDTLLKRARNAYCRVFGTSKRTGLC